ncbi:hypothetical protein FACS1894206_02140 [Deltaproteobacteria bacterium]|nr:hypothetical protein FACS1894206_02140 [Deltaproteobacteria bacterium]
MRTIIALPPVSRMTGGIAVLYQLSARLRECGHELVLTGASAVPGLAQAAQSGFPVIPWDAVRDKTEGGRLCPDDIFVIAEGWPSMMAPALSANSRVLVYAQNWSYVFSALPEGVLLHTLPLSFLAVSHPVAHFIGDMAGLPLTGIIRPCIDPSLFHPFTREASEAGRPSPVRVAWMPRKNKGLAEQVRQILSGMNRGKFCSLVEWVEIRNMPPGEVARTLASCSIFLATGFPEGCPLPPLEAMACACLVVGFTGFGGWDYMRQAGSGKYAPRIPLRGVPWQGNGLFASDGDVVEAALLLAEAITMVRENTKQRHAVLAEASRTAAAYSQDAQREEVRMIWSKLHE